MAELFETESKALELSPLQEKICAVPECYSLFLGGGRGGAKSHALCFIALQHMAQYGERARVLYIRQTYKSLADFEEITRNLFYGIYGKAARYNHTEGVWRMPNGAYFEIGQMEGPESWPKYVGRSFTLILIDEVTQFATPELLDRLNSNLRGPIGIPLRVAYAGNPGECGHQWVAQRYVFRATPWLPFVESTTKRQWVYVPSTYLDNPFIDREEYRKQLESSCPADPELLASWLSGDWSINRGSFFALVLSEERNCSDPWPQHMDLTPEAYPTGIGGTYLVACETPWKFFVVFDWGLSDPGYAGLFAKSPGAKGPDGKYYAKGSIILIDEICSNVPGQLNVGQRWDIGRWAEAMKRMWKKWNLTGSVKGFCDVAIEADQGRKDGSLGDCLRREGIFLSGVPKAREGGWERSRVMMVNAGTNEKPSFHAARNCTYFWSTAPFIGRNPRDQGDLDTNSFDHACDVVRYACVSQHGLRQREFRC